MKFDKEIQALHKKAEKIQGFSDLAEKLITVEKTVESVESERGEAFLLPYSSPSMLPVTQWKLTNNA